MNNAFTLFGELKADTNSFQNSLRSSEARLESTKKSLDETEKRAQKLGQSTAVSARSFEKLNEKLSEARTRLSNAAEGFNRGVVSSKQFQSALAQSERSASLLNSRLRDTSARITDANQKSSAFSAALGGMARYIPAAAAISAFAVKSAMNLENVRNRFTALEGSVEKANLRIQKLVNLSRQSVGVNMEDAFDNFAQLNAIGGIAENNIEKIIQAVGRLNTAFEIDSQKDFLRNLTQIFTQGFERADIKEAIGRVPIFEQILEKAFGSKDAEKLKELKAKGKLTLDSFMGGIAEAIQNDSRLKGLNQTFSEKLSKAFSEINLALAPLGQKIVDAVSPVLNDSISELQKNQSWEDLGKNIGERVGKGIGEGLRNSVPNAIESMKSRLSSDFSGKTIPISLSFNISMAKGILEGLTGDAINNIQDALQSFGKVFSTVFNEMFKIMSYVPIKFYQAMIFIPTMLGTLAVTVAAKSVQIGTAIVTGIVNGISSGVSWVASAANNLANSAVSAAKSALGIQSPSKVFYEIGENTIQGFANGITKNVPKIATTLTSSIAKQVKEFQKQLKDLLSENDATTKGGGQIFDLKFQITGAEKTKSILEDIIKLRIETGLNTNKPLLADEGEIFRLETIRDRISDIGGAVKDIVLEKGDWKFVENLNAILANSDNAKLIKDYAASIGTTADEFKRLAANAQLAFVIAELSKDLDLRPPDIDRPSGEGLGIGESLTVPPEVMEQAPELGKRWANFFSTFRTGIREMKDSLPDLKTSIGENLLDSISQIGNVFSSAMTNADGTIQGFFRGVASGFADMARQIIAEMVRIAVMKLILNLTSMFAGGGSSAGGFDTSGPAAFAGAAFSGAPGFASGGYTGTGNRLDVAGIVHKEEFVQPMSAVRKYGRGFMESVRNLSLPSPQMAMDGGGSMPVSNTTTSSNVTNNYHMPPIHVSGGQNAAATQMSLKQMIRQVMDEMKREDARRK